jgi:two-component system cell cycle sensor histidine kinase/response regulator CckA
MTMRHFSFIKGLVAAALIAVIILPLFTYFYLYPAFSKLVIRETEIEAKRLASHLISYSLAETDTSDLLNKHIVTHIDQAVTDFEVLKVKLFTPAGKTVFSTDQREIGTFNDKAYFHDMIADGRPYSKVIKKNTRTLDGELAVRDVVEVYVPISTDNTARGAFEIYYDITNSQQKIYALLKRLNLSLMLIVTVLVLAVALGALRASRKIDRQQKSQESLRRERNFIHTILNTVSVAVMVFDRDLRITFLNHQGEKISGYSLEEVLGRHIWDFLLIPEEADKVRKALGTSLLNGETTRLDSFWVTKHGERRLLSWSNSTLTAVDGEPEYIIATGVDITESKQISSMLMQAKDEWENTFDTIGDAITIHDHEMNIIRANAAAQTIIGRPLSEIVSQKCYLLYHGTTCPPTECASCQTLKSGHPSITETYEPHLDKYLELKAYPRFDKNNKLNGMIHIVRDISQRKMAEEEQHQLQAQLIQSQKMEAIGQLAGGVAHDFNNLLTGIIGYVGLAREQVAADLPAHEDLTETLDLAKRAASLTRQLLAFSRRQILEPDSVNINNLVQDMSKLLQRLIGEDITLSFQPTPDIGQVFADPGQIEQVLVNLAVNSRQAMPNGGNLTITTSEVVLGETESNLRQVIVPPGSYIRLSIADTGIGIDKKIQQQIFDPFFTTKEVGIGSGLGLSTAYGIIKQHNGFIWVESEPGQGATFIIYLPVSESVEESEELGRNFRMVTSPTILVVEDDAAVLQVMQRMLQNLGYKAMTALGPDEAEEIFLNNRDEISLLLTDVILPLRNGKELFKRLHQQNPSMAVLYMSGHTQDIIIQKGILGKDFPFIKKPFTQDDLGRKLHSLLHP